MHGKNYLGKAIYETTSCDWIYPGVSHVQSDHQGLWKESSNILVFLHRVSYLGELASELLPLVTCSQLSLLPSQVAGSFDQQYFRKEPNGIVNVLHGYNRQWKVASEATTLRGF